MAALVNCCALLGRLLPWEFLFEIAEDALQLFTELRI
jgi:hypothetical protein